MGKPQHKVMLKWSPNFAYAVGLITTDGNLSPNGRTINFTSKDKELIDHIKNCFKISNKVGRKGRGGSKDKKYYVIQIGDICFYKFLRDLGLMPKKSKILGTLSIPRQFFFDFLRGHFDGDGTFYSYWDPRWKRSFMFYTTFVSASEKHITWLRASIAHLLSIQGHITKAKNSVIYQLKYAKQDSLKILKKLYPQPNIICLERKRLKIQKALATIGIPL